MTIHLHPTAPLAERVLLPADPGRALLLAQKLLAAPAMFNHNRGLWGYTGNAVDGQPLTVQSTGMGGPSAAIVISELAELGARRLLRVGTCAALDPALALGELLMVSQVIGEDGTSRALGVDAPLGPDPGLEAAVCQAGEGAVRRGAVVSTDLFYDRPSASQQRWRDAGAIAVEMETAALFAVAERRGLQAASLLLVSELLLTRSRLTPEGLQAAEVRLAEVAARALAEVEAMRSATPLYDVNAAAS